MCHCKQGSVSACTALAETHPELAQNLMRAAAMAKAAQEAGKTVEKAAGAVDTGCPKNPNDDDDQECTGQEHHVISKTVWRALELHLTLKGKYLSRDPRFVTRAKDLQAHCGWSGWHRQVDKEIAEWVTQRLNKKITPEQFETYLREVYARPELRARFPSGF